MTVTATSRYSCSKHFGKLCRQKVHCERKYLSNVRCATIFSGQILPNTVPTLTCPRMRVTVVDVQVSSLLWGSSNRWRNAGSCLRRASSTCEGVNPTTMLFTTLTLITSLCEPNWHTVSFPSRRTNESYITRHKHFVRVASLIRLRLYLKRRI